MAGNHQSRPSGAGDLTPILSAFARIRLINLRSRPDRLRQAMAELQRAGIARQGGRFAVHSADKPAEAAGFPSPGARGCFTSHREVMREAQTSGCDNLLVFEDDIALPAVDPAAVAAVAAALRSTDWQVVYFGYLRPAPPDAPPGLHKTAAPTLGGHFYGIRQPLLGRMVAFMDACEARPPGHPEGGPMFRDGAFNHYRRLHPDTPVHLAVPLLGTQRASRTDLHRLPWPDRLPGVRLLAGLARRLAPRR